MSIISQQITCLVLALAAISVLSSTISGPAPGSPQAPPPLSAVVVASADAIPSFVVSTSQKSQAFTLKNKAMTSLAEQDQLGNNLGKGEASLPSFDLPSHPNIAELEYSTPQQRKTHLDRLYLNKQNRPGRSHFGLHKPSLGYINPVHLDSLEPMQMKSLPAYPEPLEPLGPVLVELDSTLDIIEPVKPREPVLGKLDLTLDINEPSKPRLPVLGERDSALDRNEAAKPQAQQAQTTNPPQSASQVPPVVQTTQSPITTQKATTVPTAPTQTTTQSTVKPTPAPTTVVPTTAEKSVPTQPPQLVPARITSLPPIITSKATSASNTAEPTTKPTTASTTVIPTTAAKLVSTLPPQNVHAQTTTTRPTSAPTTIVDVITTHPTVKPTSVPTTVVPITTAKPVPTQTSQTVHAQTTAQPPITTAKPTSAPTTAEPSTKSTPASTTAVLTTAAKLVSTLPPQTVPAQTTTAKPTLAPTTHVDVTTTQPTVKPTSVPTTVVPITAAKLVATQPSQIVSAQTTAQPSTPKPTQPETVVTTASAAKTTLPSAAPVPTTQATTPKPVPTQAALVTQQAHTTTAQPIKPVPSGTPSPSPIAHDHSAATTTVAPKASVLVPPVIVQVVQPSAPLAVPPSVVMKMTDHFLKGQFYRSKQASKNQTITLLSVSSSSIYPYSTGQEGPPPLTDPQIQQIPPIPIEVPIPVPTPSKPLNKVQPLVKITSIESSGSTTAHFNITITNKALGAPQTKSEPDILITIPKELMPTVNGIITPKTINVTVFSDKPAEKKPNNPTMLIVETTTTPGPQPLSDFVKPVVKITAKEASGTSSGHFNITITNKLVNSTHLKPEPDVFITIPKDLAKNNAKTINVTVFADQITTYSFKEKPKNTNPEKKVDPLSSSVSQPGPATVVTTAAPQALVQPGPPPPLGKLPLGLVQGPLVQNPPIQNIKIVANPTPALEASNAIPKSINLSISDPLAKTVVSTAPNIAVVVPTSLSAKANEMAPTINVTIKSNDSLPGSTNTAVPDVKVSVPTSQGNITSPCYFFNANGVQVAPAIKVKVSADSPPGVPPPQNISIYIPTNTTDPGRGGSAPALNISIKTDTPNTLPSGEKITERISISVPSNISADAKQGTSQTINVTLSKFVPGPDGKPVAQNVTYAVPVNVSDILHKSPGANITNVVVPQPGQSTAQSLPVPVPNATVAAAKAPGSAQPVNATQSPVNTSSAVPVPVFAPTIAPVVIKAPTAVPLPTVIPSVSAPGSAIPVTNVPGGVNSSSPLGLSPTQSPIVLRPPTTVPTVVAATGLPVLPSAKAPVIPSVIVPTIPPVAVPVIPPVVAPFTSKPNASVPGNPRKVDYNPDIILMLPHPVTNDTNKNQTKVDIFDNTKAPTTPLDKVTAPAPGVTIISSTQPGKPAIPALSPAIQTENSVPKLYNPPVNVTPQAINITISNPSANKLSIPSPSVNVLVPTNASVIKPGAPAPTINITINSTAPLIGQSQAVPDVKITVPTNISSNSTPGAKPPSINIKVSADSPPGVPSKQNVTIFIPTNTTDPGYNRSAPALNITMRTDTKSTPGMAEKVSISIPSNISSDNKQGQPPAINITLSSTITGPDGKAAVHNLFFTIPTDTSGIARPTGYEPQVGFIVLLNPIKITKEVNSAAIAPIGPPSAFHGLIN